ncbi:MAG TPA: FAD-dependent oxidoreductase [Candidatus Paceibacterota bacterium]|nr:FAD-dependent oxidoreductase [Candidatus Paceibacterota bacterium]
MNDSTYELLIVGGGPAGAAAAIYAARKRIKTLFLTTEWGGQSAVSSEIQNWVGTPKIMGTDLAGALKKHVELYKGDVLEVVSPAEAVELTPFDDHVEIKTKKGQTYSAKSALITTGAERRKLEVPGAAEYDQKGLTYCASCDGPLYAGKDVAVIGGGNAAFETALQLLAYCKTVTLLNRTENFRADEISIAAATAYSNMHIIKNAVPTQVVGAQFVTGIKYKDTTSGQETLLPVEGIFVEIGLLPNTTWIGDKLEKNQIGQIKVNPKTQRTSHPLIWAAGDCTDGLYHQNNIAAGDAVKALEDIYMALRRN